MTDTILRRYTYKLRPKSAQADALHYQRRMMGMLYNALLEQRVTHWRRECQKRGKGERKSLTYYDQCKELTALRRECPEWAALSSSSMAATAQRLDRAHQAFMRRASQGAGFASGFPRFRRVDDYPSIPFKRHRDCWRFDDGKWLVVRGVPGRIRARGRLPVAPKQIKTCDILWRAGDWWLSLVVEMPRRRVAGTGSAKLRLDLVSKFASLETGDGERLSGPDAAIYFAPDGRKAPNDEGVRSESPAEAHELGACDGGMAPTRPPPVPAEAPETGAGDGGGCVPCGRSVPAEAPETGAGDGGRESCRCGAGPAEAPETGAGDGLGIDRAINIPAQGKDGFEPCAETSAKFAWSAENDPETWHVNFGTLRVKDPRPQTTEDLQRKLSACVKGSNRWKRLKLRLAKRHAREARKRREAAHEYTTDLQRRFRDVTVIAPKSIADETESAAGTKRSPGAEVKFKAQLNRHILDFVPHEIMGQLDYKLAEAGGAYTRIDDDAPPSRIGAAVVNTRKAIRKARKSLNRRKSDVRHGKEHAAA